ncbi:hypothetical protein BLNAU_16391 [Blattamonas nauphoetae]|uniref:Uncharacterized protein n=1 Tax=Blattamonas nauphoetae TaxID=2049346 RepID=A0ABQ9XBE1_9EUKA|nr:hypothetical protein BLNAU_16391 [Blattamonas nauphoetae]
MESQTLHFGTGPLLSFGLTQPQTHDHLTSSALQMNTFLQFCTLVNMSSHSKQPTHRPPHFRFGSNMEQKVIGCAISNSTNHQSGTTMMDPNLGGSLACLNTSFSSCIRQSNDDMEFSFENRTQTDIGRFKIDSSSTLTSVSFTLCTFKDMTTPEQGTERGSAICLIQCNASLTITQCFFLNCVAPSMNAHGGAVGVSYNNGNRHPVEMRNSSFTECATLNRRGEFGGAFSNSLASLFTMEFCVFDRCSSMNGGAAYISYPPTTLSNCASQDVLFVNMSYDVVNSNTIMFCDSTSGAPNVNFNRTEIVDSTLIPQMTTDKKVFVSSFEMSMAEAKATITIQTSSEVNGTMGVLLEGSNVPRLVHIEFGTTSSTSATGTAEVSKGPQGVLPNLADGLSYDLRSVSIPGFSLTIKLPPNVTGASLKWTDDRCLYLVLKVWGVWLPADSKSRFTVTISNSSETFLVRFISSTDGQSDPILVTPAIDLKWEQNYTILSIEEAVPSDPQIVICSNVVFTVPILPRLATVHVSSGNGEDRSDCGGESDPCRTMEHAFTRLSNGKSSLLLQGTFSHVSVCEISFSSLVVSHNRVFGDAGSTTTHSTIRIGKEGGLVVDGATETKLESLSFVLPSLSTVEAYAVIKTGLLTIMSCVVTGDVSTSSSLSARHPSFVKTRNVMDLVRLTTNQLEHQSVATLLTQPSVGLTQILKWEAESVHTQSTAGSAAFFTLSNTSSLHLSSSSFTTCSSSNANCLGGGVSFTLSGSASLVIQFCSFVSCSVGDGGRGGGVGLSFSSDSTNNYLLDTLTFAHNTATFGRDLFILAESLEKTVTIDHFLFNLHPPGFDRSNALFGSDHVAYVEETDLFPFLFPNNRYKNVFVDSLDETGQASTSVECGRESLPCLSLRDSMDHLLNADSEEELSQCVLERNIVLIGDFVFGEEDDVELCGYVTVGQQAGLVLSIIPLRTHKGTQTDPVQYGRVRFDESGSIGCRLLFGLSEVVPPQTVLMKHLEFVLPLFSTHPQPIIAVQSASLSLVDCVVTSIDPTQAVCSLLSFHTSLTSMTESVRLSVSRLVAQNLLLSQPLISIRSSADLPPLMDSLSTGHSSMLTQTLPFSLPPSLSIESSIFESVSLRIDAALDDPVETGSVLFADLSLPLSKLSIRDCSFSSCSTVVVSVPVESHLLSSLSCGVCCFSLARSHLTLTDSSFVNCSFIIDPSCVVPPSPSLLVFTSHALAVRFLPSQNISQLASPLSAAIIDSPLMATIQSATLTNPSFLSDDALKHSPLASHLELVGVEMDAGSSLDPFHPLPLALFVSEHCTPSLSAHSCVFRFDTADPLNVGLAVVRVRSGAWPAQRNMLSIQLKIEITIDTAVEDFERGMSRPEAVVNSRVWHNIPILIRDCDLLEEKNIHKMERLIQSILPMLTVCLKNDISIINRRMLHSSLSTLAQSTSLPKTIRVGVGQCLLSLDSFEDDPFVLVAADEFKSMEETALRNSQTISDQKEEINQLTNTISALRRQHREDEKRHIRNEAELIFQNDELKLQLADLPDAIDIEHAGSKHPSVADLINTRTTRWDDIRNQHIQREAPAQSTFKLRDPFHPYLAPLSSESVLPQVQPVPAPMLKKSELKADSHLTSSARRSLFQQVDEEMMDMWGHNTSDSDDDSSADSDE